MLCIMGLFQEIINVDATPGGILGAVLLHFAIWLVLHNYESGLMHVIKNALQGPVYKNEILENFKDDPTVKLLGMHDEPQMVYVWSIACCMNHGWGVLLMLIGWYRGQSWVWRHGMLTEVAGLDALDCLIRLPWCFLFPPGPMPMAACVKHSSPWLCLSCFYHSVGMSVGMCGPFFVLVPGLIANRFPPSAYVMHCADRCIQCFVFVYQRDIWYYPTVYGLVTFAIGQDIPFWQSPVLSMQFVPCRCSILRSP